VTLKETEPLVVFRWLLADKDKEWMAALVRDLYTHKGGAVSAHCRGPRKGAEARREAAPNRAHASQRRPPCSSDVLCDVVFAGAGGESPTRARPPPPAALAQQGRRGDVPRAPTGGAEGARMGVRVQCWALYVRLCRAGARASASQPRDGWVLLMVGKGRRGRGYGDCDTKHC
jgi:hypothetical protein